MDVSSKIVSSLLGTFPIGVLIITLGLINYLGVKDIKERINRLEKFFMEHLKNHSIDVK